MAKRKLTRTVIGRDNKGHFAKLDRRKQQRLILLINGRYNKETKTYKRQTIRGVISFELSRPKRKKVVKVFKEAIPSAKLNLLQMKNNAIPFSEYNKRIKRVYKDGLYGNKSDGEPILLVDNEKFFVLDNIATISSTFNSMLVAFGSNTKEIFYISILITPDHEHIKFSEIWTQLDFDILTKNLAKLTRTVGSPPEQAAEILLIELRDISGGKYAITNGIQQIN